LYIARIDKSCELRESGPCADCLSIIKELGIKRVVYSSGHNEISACHPDNYKVQHQTVGRRFLKEEPSDDDSDGENPSGYRNNTNTCMCNKSYSRPSLRKR